MEYNTFLEVMTGQRSKSQKKEKKDRKPRPRNWQRRRGESDKSSIRLVHAPCIVLFGQPVVSFGHPSPIFCCIPPFAATAHCSIPQYLRERCIGRRALVNYDDFVRGRVCMLHVHLVQQPEATLIGYKPFLRHASPDTEDILRLESSASRALVR